MVVMMENEGYSDIIGSSAAPNLNQLAQHYSLATQSYAVGHPSLPNYLEMLSGSTQNVTDDGTPQSENIPAATTTFANQLDSAGISWRGYFESMPSAGYTGGDAGGTDPFGGPFYLQRHNPFVYFPAVTSLADFSSQRRAAGIQLHHRPQLGRCPRLRVGHPQRRRRLPRRPADGRWRRRAHRR